MKKEEDHIWSPPIFNSDLGHHYSSCAKCKAMRNAYADKDGVIYGDAYYNCKLMGHSWGVEEYRITGERYRRCLNPDCNYIGIGYTQSPIVASNA